MARKLKSDKVLFLATVTLVVLSVLMVYSASAAIAYERYGSEWTFVVKQLMWALIGSATAVTIALTFLLPGLHRHRVPAGDEAT